MGTSLWQLLSEYKVTIPILQRDFAQGRQTGKVPSIRKKFLDALCSDIMTREKPLELDFIYGYSTTDVSNPVKRFVPLDGQQRLTTLFLFHWYIGVLEKKNVEELKLLGNFTYETRHSSRVFCSELIKFIPEDFKTPIRKTIIDQPWFFTAWENDPTIGSMLNMLNAIQEVVNEYQLSDIWPLLTSDHSKIVFHLLPMEKLGLPDDLYIKMNSRGKELTEFEYFKSWFSEILNKEQAATFNLNVDQIWSDLFWNLYKDNTDDDIAKDVDAGFLRFFKFITDILIDKNEIDIGTEKEDFNVCKIVYSNSENVAFLFESLNVFHSIYHENETFFDSIFYINESDFLSDKTRLFFQNPSIDLFEKCAKGYAPEQRINPFSLGEQLMLFACILHKIHQTENFSSRIRSIRNLIANSGDNMRKEYMADLLDSVFEIVLNNKLDEELKFNTTQTIEEILKQNYIQKNVDLKSSIYKLEDHHLLQGCTAMFWLDGEFKDYTDSFWQVFNRECNYELINKALLTFGDYTQEFGKWYTQLGKNEKYWRELLTPSNFKHGFEKTRARLFDLLDNSINNLEFFVDEYLNTFELDKNKPKSWEYYFLKYDKFWGSKLGFYYWESDTDPYTFWMMNASTTGGYSWSPFLVALQSESGITMSLDAMKAPLVLVVDNASIRISNVKAGFKFEARDEESIMFLDEIRKKFVLSAEDIYCIKQNSEGLDIDDRIEKGVDVISEIVKL